MKTKNLLILFLVSALFLLAGCAQTNPPQACTQDAKQCPDGSYVGRTGPNCTFAPCPNVTSCGCPQGYTQEGNVCNPKCYNSTLQCLMPSIPCNATEQMAKAKACVDSFGNVTVAACCNSVSDFPDTCLIGACGCSPYNSHTVMACNCGEGRCWNSNLNTCMTPTPILPTTNNTQNQTQSNVTEAVSSVVNGNTQFAFDLYSQYASQDGNIFFSPYSISTALAMTYEGARNTTAEEMRSVMHFPQDNATLRAGFEALYSEINSKNSAYNLSTANALWAQKDFKFLDSYMSIVQTYYGGNVTNLDFAGDPENSRITINNWVAEQTNQKIQNLIPQGYIDALTRLVLTNAVYFKAKWRIPFLNATDADFTVSPNNIIKVKMMSIEGDNVRTADGEPVPIEFNYAETNETQVIELPYEGNSTSMLILLPKGNNLHNFEQSLTAEKLNGLKGMLQETYLGGVYVPKFKFETKYFLSETLQNMGMKKAFSDADFSGMDGKNDLYIYEVIHQAYIQVNETGTEAAAATAVIMRLTAMPVQPPVFRADHPFIFIIQQRDTGNILFMGRVSNPNE